MDSPATYKVLKFFFRTHFLVLLLLITVSCKQDTQYQSIPAHDGFLSAKEIPDSHFLGDQKCKTCHQKEFEEWQGSDHDRAMEVADRTTILANFDGEKFTSQGVTSHFYQKDNGFYVNTEGPDGQYHDYKIEYTFGVTPLQQYIVKFPDGHYQCLRTAWDTLENKWFDLYPDFKVVHSEWLHWSRGGLNWNTMCSDCHSTNVRKNYDETTHSYDTKFAIINVNCEACHGPGKQHVEEADRLGSHYKTSGSMRMTWDTAPKDLVDQCARCHMRREQFSASYNFEGTMLDHYFPQLIVENIYYPDGQILDEDYVYGSFVQSKMYQNDVSCNNCHNSHSLKLRFEGNRLCAQCHSSEEYDTPKHHFHQANTDGAQCINCHMTGRYYMGNDFRRDHSFRIPRPDQSLKYGTPNACTGCHTDKSDSWAWEAFQNLFGQVDSIHFSDKLAPGILGEPHAHVGLTQLVQDKSQPEIIRASAVRALSQYREPDLIEKYLALLNDDSPMVRGTTLDVLSEINNVDYVSYFLPLLNDGKRTVRIKAFYALAGITELQIPEPYKDSYQHVKKEFDTYLKGNLDFVGGQVKRANFYLKQGDIHQAIEGYEKALQMDFLNNQVRLDLANLYYNNNDYQKSEDAYKTVISQEPEYGPAYYSLALLYAEMERTDEAIEQMQKATDLMPDNLRAYYNLSLLYDKKHEAAKAEDILLKGLKIDSNNENLLYALVYHFYNKNDMKKAQLYLTKLTQLYPENAQYKNLLQSMNL